MAHLILSVEDDDATFLLLKMAVDQLGDAFELHRAVDGEVALALLNRLCEADARLPSLILLDLNLPKLTGTDVLEAINLNGRLSAVPVVMFTSSVFSSDKTRCLKLGAKEFITKPNNVQDFFRSVQSACALVANA